MKKSFNQLILELNEVKFKVPKGSKELKRDLASED